MPNTLRELVDLDSVVYVAHATFLHSRYIFALSVISFVRGGA